MLGFEVRVFEEGRAERGATPLMRWRTSMGGLKWLDALVEAGRADSMYGCGYPDTYTLVLGDLLNALRDGLPMHGGPPVIGEDYALPAGYNSELEINRDELVLLRPEMRVVVEAWDMS